MMTKTERIQVIQTYFDQVAQIDGKVPCIQWKHKEQPNLIMYSREDESLERYEVVLVKSSAAKVDTALQHSVKHFFQDAEELEILLRSLSEKALAKQKVSRPENKPAFKPKKKPAINNIKEPVSLQQNVNNQFQSMPVNNSTINTATHIPNRPNVSASYPPSTFSSSPASTISKFRPKGIWLGLLIVGMLFLSAFLTNPTLDKHQRTVHKSSYAQLMEAPIPGSTENSDDSEFTPTLVSTTDNEVGTTTSVRRQDFFFFSLTEIQFPDYEKIVGIGIFGNVFLDDPKSNSLEASNTDDNDELSGEDQEKLEEMKRAVIVAVMDKFYADANNQQDFTYKFVFHNRSNRSINSFNGQVYFNDAEGNLIKTLPLTYDRPLGIGERAVFHVVDETVIDKQENQALVSSSISDLSVEWEPSELQFKDGSSMSM